MLTAILLTALLPAQEPSLAPSQEPSQGPYFHLQVSAKHELWCEVLYQAGLEGEVAEGPLAGAARAVRELDRVLAAQENWMNIHGPVLAVELGEALSAKVKLPKFMLGEGFKRREVRGAIDTLLAEYDSAAASGRLETEWPAREAALNERVAEQNERMTEAVRQGIWARADRWLLVPQPKRPIDVFFVTHCPGRGTVSVMVGDVPNCLVACTDRAGLALTETWLHEVMHGLETIPTFPVPLFGDLSAALIGERIRDQKFRRYWSHVVYGLAAAQLVRDAIDPGHVDTGLSDGWYELEAPGAHAVLQPIWQQYVGEEFPRAIFVRKASKAIAAAWKASVDEER